MKDFARQTLTNLAPVMGCLVVLLGILLCATVSHDPAGSGAVPDATAQSAPTHVDGTTLLLPKRASLDPARACMLTTQRAMYQNALCRYQAALARDPATALSPKAIALQKTMRCASREYGFVAQETSDTAFTRYRLPRTLPSP